MPMSYIASRIREDKRQLRLNGALYATALIYGAFRAQPFHLLNAKHEARSHANRFLLKPWRAEQRR
jgi:hypothetical protein